MQNRSQLQPGIAATAPPRSLRMVVACDLLALALLGLLLATPLRGHSIKPHNDFVELAEVGVCLVRGELPPTFKRAPLYPLLIGAGGVVLHTLGVQDPPPERLAAELINLALYPLNGILVYLLLWRWCQSGRGGSDAARWGAVAFLFLPWGLYCTAYLLVEPLLITTILGTVLLAGTRHRGLAYAAAALATMTRFDAAALIPGLMLADRLNAPPRRRFWLAGLVAAVPLVIWLVVTAVTWSRCGDEHYLQHLYQRPTFDPVWATRAVLDVVFSPARLFVPVWTAVDPDALRSGVRLFLALAAVAGTLRLLLRRDAAAVVAAVGALGYLFVHAVFPYQFLRFGYPLAPLLLGAAGGGLAAGWRWLGTNQSLRPLRGLLIAVVVALGVPLAFGELGSLAALPFDPSAWVPTVLVNVIVPLVLLWAAPGLRRPARLLRFLPLVALLVLARVQLRETAPLLGSGRDMATLVESARWVAAHVPPDAGVLCDHRAMFFLYARDRDPRRFVSYDRMRADAWSDILGECRRRGIRYLVWHSRIVQEHTDPCDPARFRFERFAPLSAGVDVPGLELVWSVRGAPDVWVWRIADPPSTSASSVSTRRGATP